MNLALAPKSQANPVNDLLEFTKRTFGKLGRVYVPNWHHELLAKELEAWARREFEFLFVSMPAGYGKSELISRSLPAWLMGRDPATTIMAACHTQQKVDKFSADVKRKIGSDEYRSIFPGLEVDPEFKRALGYWRNNFGGAFYGFGTGAACSGDHANWIIVDDPVKGDKHIQNPLNREKDWSWFTAEITQRVIHAEGRPQVLLMHTRWNHDDIAGRMIKLVERIPKSQKAKYRFLVLPAVLDDRTVRTKHSGDPRGVGEPLWPTAHNLDQLKVEELRNRRNYQAQFLCNPITPNAGMVKRSWFKPVAQNALERGLLWHRYFWVPALEPSSLDQRVGICDAAKDDQGQVFFRMPRALDLHFDEALELMRQSVKEGGIKKIGVYEGRQKSTLLEDLLRFPSLVSKVRTISGSDPLSLAEPGLAGKLFLVEDPQNESFLEECDQWQGRLDSAEAMIRAVSGAFSLFRSQRSVLEVCLSKITTPA